MFLVSPDMRCYSNRAVYYVNSSPRDPELKGKKVWYIVLFIMSRNLTNFPELLSSSPGLWWLVFMSICNKLASSMQEASTENFSDILN